MPNQRGINTFDTLVVSSATPAHTPAKQTKLQKNLEWMEFVLNTYCKNNATYMQWFEEIHSTTAKRKNNTIVKDGWSQKTFDRYLKKLAEQGRVTGGGDKGNSYSVLWTERAHLARKTETLQPNDPEDTPEDNSTDLAPIEKSSGNITVTVIPLRGNDGDDGNNYCRLSPSNHRQNENDGNARESGTGSPEPVATELLREVWEGLERSKLKS
jgi:hypothetical protein